MACALVESRLTIFRFELGAWNVRSAGKNCQGDRPRQDEELHRVEFLFDYSHETDLLGARTVAYILLMHLATMTFLTGCLISLSSFCTGPCSTGDRVRIHCKRYCRDYCGIAGYQALSLRHSSAMFIFCQYMIKTYQFGFNDW